jgi:hypothetical protein
LTGEAETGVVDFVKMKIDLGVGNRLTGSDDGFVGVDLVSIERNGGGE